jgi:hypothetical protein
MKFIEKIFNAIFSFAGFMIIGISVIFFLIISMAAEQSEIEAEQQATTEAIASACYDLKMVPVITAAGDRCVAPEYLVEVQ